MHTYAWDAMIPCRISDDALNLSEILLGLTNDAVWLGNDTQFSAF